MRRGKGEAVGAHPCDGDVGCDQLHVIRQHFNARTAVVNIFEAQTLISALLLLIVGNRRQVPERRRLQ